MKEWSFDTGALHLNLAEGPQNGRPLLMLHGVTMWWQDFLPVLPHLSQNTHVFAFDSRGCGKSDRAGGLYRVRDYADDIIAYLNSGWYSEPVDLLGHSLGAHIALMVANAVPDRVRSVILEDLPVRTADGRLVGRPHQPLFPVWIDIMKDDPPFDELVKRLAKAMPDDPPTKHRYRAKSLQSLDMDVLSVYVDGDIFNGYDPEALLAGLNCPALLVHADPTIFARLEPPEAKRAVALAPDACAVMIEGAGHNVHGDRPVQYCRTVQEFLMSL